MRTPWVFLATIPALFRVRGRKRSTSVDRCSRHVRLHCSPSPPSVQFRSNEMQRPPQGDVERLAYLMYGNMDLAFRLLGALYKDLSPEDQDKLRSDRQLVYGWPETSLTVNFGREQRILLEYRGLRAGSIEFVVGEEYVRSTITCEGTPPVGGVHAGTMTPLVWPADAIVRGIKRDLASFMHFIINGEPPLFFGLPRRPCMP